ncbi:MAG: MSMEG_0567/Sll0786 family nitrogen starvation N-acetyltransferase [Nocardioides sp.]
MSTGRSASAGLASPELLCADACTLADLEMHRAIRRAVFVEEQGIFEGSDADAQDEDPRTVHVLGWVGDQPGGAVRLYPLDDDGLRWQGDRLAVLPQFRAAGLGGPLVRHAVATAARLGGTHMVAHIQTPNVRFFQHLGWEPDGAEEIYVGRTHQPMIIRW